MAKAADESPGGRHEGALDGEAARGAGGSSRGGARVGRVTALGSPGSFAFVRAEAPAQPVAETTVSLPD
jgi:hypothetical protein